MIEMNEAQRLAEVGLNPALILQELSKRGIELPELRAYYEIDSTNKEARLYSAASSDKRTAVFIADGQTAGRGRRGRSFCSPHGVGLYMSFLLYPEGAIGNFTSITTYTAVAVCRAIERICGLHADIKWVNDIYYKGRKLGGILTEGALSGDMVTAEQVVVGIGLNVLRCGLPDGLSDIAVSLEEACGKRIDRNLLIAEIIYELLGGLGSLGSHAVLEEYRRRSFLVGRDITVHRLDRSYPARVLGIGDDMSLRIRLSDGSEEKLITGEVSVRER